MFHSPESPGSRRRKLSVGTALASGGLILSAILALSACTTTIASAGGESNSTSAAASATCSPTAAASDAPGVQAALEIVKKASLPVTKWDGPTTGPKAHPGTSVVYIASNASNTGDTAPYTGLKQAAEKLGWKLTFIDGKGSGSANLNALSQAIALHPSAIVVSSFDANSSEPLFAQAAAAGIPVIGNHTGNNAGVQSEYPDLFTNITSDPVTIARVAADCAIVASAGKAGVTIVGCGAEFSICQVKQDAMRKAVEACSGCTVLANETFPFENISQQEPGLATADYQKYGSKLTYMLSINDLYWDSAIPALQAAGVSPSGPPAMIAAGDGSPAAFSRIRKGEYQIATVAEPLQEHGWQMADEVNRAINHQAPSPFVTYPRLVTKENVDLEGGKKGTFDPANNYRNEYEKIWGVG
ncbi:substrate-binding domain-containing protein [Lacisediminihabitans profunda]|uniref:Substrate-binding domain-containing protein n=1 Tax=Lacisediminihabitans profunda TaxID=2594790 RepID=A0A5C8UNA1_9MICO|nr:substrate-binding domain-containing protein [Lacisediminihabitans profunda]TXN28757.1 substrate-binding domain-containing protein [Lacisediminihabitans profunda]